MFSFQVHTGAGAVRAMYSALGLGWLWSWTKVPGITNVVDSAYAWFARNRLWLSHRENVCDTGKCEAKLQPKQKDKSNM